MRVYKNATDDVEGIVYVTLGRAHGLLRRFRTYTKALRTLRFEGVQVPKSYEDGFRDALLTFRHQWWGGAG